MDLINKKVKHVSFGTGIVVDHQDSYVEIDFQDKPQKKFIFPDAFDKFLKLEDSQLHTRIQEQINQERAAEEAKLVEIEAEMREERLKNQAQKGSGGSENDSSRQVVFWCEEQEIKQVFSDWNISTGTIKSGARAGQPNKLVRLNEKSVCLLTGRAADQEEKERAILGFFLIDEGFSGRVCEDGNIPAHEKYRLRLTNEEAKKMPFWKYYTNKRFPEKMTWNTGRHRYFDNIIMAQILRDIVSLKAETDHSELAQEFFKHFCYLNQILENDIPENSGVLSRT